MPEPLQPDGSNQVFYEWINMPDSSGFGSYEEPGVVIPCVYDDEPVNCTAMMFLNDEPPISAGREIWGFPKRWGEPRLMVEESRNHGKVGFGAGGAVALAATSLNTDRLRHAAQEPAHARFSAVEYTTAEQVWLVHADLHS